MGEAKNLHIVVYSVESLKKKYCCYSLWLRYIPKGRINLSLAALLGRIFKVLVRYHVFTTAIKVRRVTFMWPVDYNNKIEYY